MANKRSSNKKMTLSMRKTIIIFFIIVVLLFIALMVKVSYIQIAMGDVYEKIVLSQQDYDSETIPYRRGDIVDSKGTLLATSTDVYNLILDCKVMTSTDSTESTLAALFSFFPQLDEEEIRNIVKEKPLSQYNVLLRQLSFDEMNEFEMYRLSQVDRPKEERQIIKGVWFEKYYIRSYPYGELASSVIGFTTPDGQGSNGLENSYNSALSGINGRKYGYLNSDNDFEKTLKDAKDGLTVVSTLDATLQGIVENKIKEYNRYYNGAYREGEMAAEHIGVVIMRPKNAEVIAMANYPNFDLSNPRDLSKYYSDEELEAMTDEEQLDALNRLWQNFCVSYTYEPGSTAKPFTVACGLETGKLTGNETFECDGYEEISDYKIRCVNVYGHGTETVEKSLMDSCNDALMQMSYRIGAHEFSRYQRIFGFGLRTNIDVPGEARTDSLIYKEDDMRLVSLATNSFGQNFNTTMIQLAGGFCSLINGGNYYQPHLVSKTRDGNGNIVDSYEGALLKQTVSVDTSEKIKGYLKSTVDSGTAKYAKVPGFSMGGKTGTAQISVTGGKDEKNYLVSFIGYLPADDPEILIYTVIDRPNAKDQAHSTFAQNLTREILEEALPYLNMFPDEAVGANALSSEETNMYSYVSEFEGRTPGVDYEYPEEPEETIDGENIGEDAESEDIVSEEP